jgi:hypothetical protein
MKYYIAYGSNLNIDHMSVRCPNAIPVGTTVLEDWTLAFHMHLNIERCFTCQVPAVVWEITDADEQALDRYEGYPDYYTKKTLTVWVHAFTGRLKKVDAMVYIMRFIPAPLMPPTQDYYQSVLKGYEDFRIDTTPLNAALEKAKAYCRSRYDEDKEVLE